MKQSDASNQSIRPTPLDITIGNDETNRQAICRKITGPFTRHAFVTGEACERLLTSFDAADKPGITEFASSIKERADKAASGDLGDVSALFMAQALSLDSIFTEYARIALVNVSSNTEASERYMRLAMKAQANSRATLEALAKLHQPREQTVKHVHVNSGGQAVVADTIHQHTGGAENAKTDEQSLATATDGTSAALPSPNPVGDGVSITSREGEAAMQDARRE